MRRLHRFEPPPLSWQDFAACRDMDTDVFFPERGESTKEAKKACAHCPVRDICAEHALSFPEPFGHWGGLSERARRRIRRQRRQGKAA